MQTYHAQYQFSIEQPEAFWQQQAHRIAWYEAPPTVLSTDADGFHRWYAGGKLNTCYLALDHHVENGRADQVALVYDSPVTQTVRRFTYRELRDAVAQFAGGLRSLGVEKGDTVIIYMPMIPEAVIGMLACARLGAVHSVVFGGFAPNELAIRINDAQPKAILSASCGIEVDRVLSYKPLLDKAIELATHQPAAAVICQRPMCRADLQPGRDHDWYDLADAATPANCVVLDALDPLYILYTSGTTGKPKGIVRDNGGHAVALHYSLDTIYGIRPGETFWAASDIGWAVGHSYIVYGPLIYGCTTVLFEGKPVRTPDASTFWRVMHDHRVTVFFTAPTAIRAIKKEDSEGKLLQPYDLSALRYFFLAGERCDPATYDWVHERLGIPVIDHWWQTESGWPMIANPMGLEPLPIKPGSSAVPVCSYDIRVFDESGAEVPANTKGALVIKLPLAPGCFPFLWRDKARFHTAYLSAYPGYYLTGDGGYKDGDGYIYILGRIDDVINVAGHRLSTGEMEEVVAAHPAVAECAVIGVADALRGQVPVAFVVPKDGADRDPAELEREVVARVREQIGAVAYLRRALVVKRLPKTRSGKILRNVMRHLADGESFAAPSTIDDPLILEEIRDDLRTARVGNAFTS